MTERTAGHNNREPSAVLESALPGSLQSAILNRSEPDILIQARERSWKLYGELSLPLRSEHLWRYTDPESFVPTDDLVRELPPQGEAAGDLPEGSWECSQCVGKIVLGGETGARVSLDEEMARQGVVLSGIVEAARKHEELLRPNFAVLTPPEMGKFEALAGALWQTGVFIHVPRGVAVERPIHLLCPHNEVAPWDGFRYVLVLEEGARVTLIEEHVGTGARSASEPSRLYGLGELHVGAGARLEHIIVQRLPENVRAHITYRTRLGRDSSSAPFMVALGGKQTKIDYGTSLGADGSRTELSGVLFGASGQMFDHHTVHDHSARNTYSNLEMRTVLTDRALSAYTGLIRIRTEAPYSEAYQENRNLVLSEKAKAESIPELEIETDEVQCKHGATVGSVDEAQVFYLMSRGIPRREAMRMIVRGFVDAVLDKAPTDLKGRLSEAVEERLQHIA